MIGGVVRVATTSNRGSVSPRGSGAGVEAQVVGHPAEGDPPAEATWRATRWMCTPLWTSTRRQRGPCRRGSRPGAEDVALVALVGERLDQVGQVLRGRGVVGPVILVDEEQRGSRPAGEAAAVSVPVAFAVATEHGRRHPAGILALEPPAAGRAVPEPSPRAHHFASAWALLARYQAMVLARPVSQVGRRRPAVEHLASSGSRRAPSSPRRRACRRSRSSCPGSPRPSWTVSASSRIVVPMPVPMFSGIAASSYSSAARTIASAQSST